MIESAFRAARLTPATNTGIQVSALVIKHTRVLGKTLRIRTTTTATPAVATVAAVVCYGSLHDD